MEEKHLYLGRGNESIGIEKNQVIVNEAKGEVDLLLYSVSES